MITSTLAPTTEVVTDPITGLSATTTSRTVIVDVKHEDNLQFNACTDELVLINGKFTMWFQVNESSSGRVEQKFHQESNGNGVGLSSGAKYSYGSAANSSSTMLGPSTTTTQTETVEEHLVRAGEMHTAMGDDFFIKTVIHLTTVNNVPTATVGKIEFPCR